MKANIKLGIITEIRIRESKDCDEFDIFENKNKIFNELNEIIDTSKFIVKQTKYGFDLRADVKYLNTNFMELFGEICKTNLDYCDSRIAEDYIYCVRKKIRRNFYKFKKFNNNYNYQNKYYKEKDLGQIYMEDKYFLIQREEEVDYRYNYFLLFKNSKLTKNLNIYIKAIFFLYHPSLFITEDPCHILYILNKFKNSYFHNELAKNLIYTIE